MRRFAVALLVGTAFTLLLNAARIPAALRGELTIATLQNHGKDELYYIALVRDAATGHANLGHTAFREHRDDAAVTTYAPLPQGLFARAMGLPVEAALFLGDLLFPLLAVAFLFLAASALFGSLPMAAAVTLAAAAYLDTYWLRTANPQIPYILVTAWLAVFFSGHPGRIARDALRGLIVGVLGWVQLLYASFFLLVEGTDLLRRLREREAWIAVLRSAWVTFGIAAVCIAAKVLFAGNPGDIAATDTIHRLGVIPSRYPAAPGVQLLLLALGALLLIARRKPSADRPRVDLLLTIVVAALLGLNQSLLHGIDATFSSYYVNILFFVFWLGGAYALWTLIPRRAAVTLFTGVAAYMLVSCAFTLHADARRDALRQDAFDRSDAPALIAWLRTQPDDRVIAAPMDLSDLIPPYTDHYVLFNSYAYNQRATDAELTERFLLERSLFPGDAQLLSDPSYGLVFGGYGGMLAARERTACKMFQPLGLKLGDCSATAASRVLHQDLLTRLRDEKPDVPALLRTYGVDLLVTTSNRSPSPDCVLQTTVGAYRVLRCDSSTLSSGEA